MYIVVNYSAFFANILIPSEFKNWRISSDPCHWTNGSAKRAKLCTFQRPKQVAFFDPWSTFNTVKEQFFFVIIVFLDRILAFVFSDYKSGQRIYRIALQTSWKIGIYTCLQKIKSYPLSLTGCVGYAHSH